MASQTAGNCNFLSSKSSNLPMLATLVMLPFTSLFYGCEKTADPAETAPAPVVRSISNWQPVTFTNEALRAKGTLTGDGAQWFRALAIDPVKGDFLLWCTDVGGLFRSLDGGKNWEPTNIGFHSRGSSGVAIDPHNTQRAVVIAANSVAHPNNGIYLTTNQAASWKQVKSIKMSASQDKRLQVAYDPATYDAALGYTTTIYWSRLSVDKPMWGDPVNEPGFYKSIDGGTTWTKVPGGEAVADAHLGVHPTDGSVYAGTPSGFKVSRDGGQTWQTTFEGGVTGLSVSKAAPDSVWITQDDGLFLSSDRGATFSTVTGAARLGNMEGVLRDIRVAPSDPSRMVLWRYGPNWQWNRYYSHDGGATWQESKLRKDFVILPTNSREGVASFHPTDPNILLIPGGDYPMMSHDGGATYQLAGNGVNNLLVGGSLQFSATNPDNIYAGSQDYASLLSTDGGKNWTYLEPAKLGWGGFNYGAYTSNAKVLIAGEASTWGKAKKLAVSRDGGSHFQMIEKDAEFNSSYGAPDDENVLFAGPYRTENAAITWTKTENASKVLTHNPRDLSLYGVNGGEIVRSTDRGRTWEVVHRHGSPVDDVAVHPSGKKVYFVSSSQLFVWDGGRVSRVDGLVRDQDGPPRVRSVAIDPVQPEIVYIAANRDTFASNASAQRSNDGGGTWTNLTLTDPLDGSQLDGGREAFWVRVHPVTREAWFAGGCYGVWRHSPPLRQ